MPSLSKKIKFSTKTWFSLLLTVFLFGAIVITQLATQNIRDNRSKAATVALSSSVVCQSTNLWGIKYNYTITDGINTVLVLATDAAMSNVVSTISIGSSSGSVTYTPAFANKTYYGQLNRFSLITGTQVSNPIGSLSCTLPPLAVPNLIIQNGSGANRSVTGPTTVTQGQTVSYTFRTANIGTGTAGASGTVVENYGTGTSNPKQDFSVGSLGVGGSVSHTFTTRWDQTGSKSMLFRADAYGNVVESNEGDNDVNLTVTVNPAPDTANPSITLTSPSNGQTKSGIITLSANASDNVGVTKVEFYIDNSLITNDISAPYSYDWNSATKPNGSHTIYAKAWDAAGNNQQSANATITVSNTTACVSNCGGTIPPGGGGTTPPSTTKPTSSAPKVTPPSATQPTAGVNDVKLTFAPNSFLQGQMTISLLVPGTGLAQNASVGKDGGVFVLKTNSILAKNTNYTLTISSKNSLVQKIGFRYVDSTAVNVGTFATGDFNSDNSIDDKDLTLFSPAGIKSGDSLYDINYDGVVNSVDYSILLINQGKKGN